MLDPREIGLRRHSIGWPGEKNTTLRLVSRNGLEIGTLGTAGLANEKGQWQLLLLV